MNATVIAAKNEKTQAEQKRLTGSKTTQNGTPKMTGKKTTMVTMMHRTPRTS
jgi:hypothetical protein